MTTLLKINVSPRGDHSVSRALSKKFAEQWQASHSSGRVIERDLAATHLPFVELPWILAAYSEPSSHDAEQKAAIKIGDELIAELKGADEWVIATPMYNLSLPARLKAYIDHVVRAGQTFQANPDGSYTGLLTGKKATVIIASAGEYGAGSPTQGYDTETPYLRTILGFIGVTDVKFVHAGSTWKVDRGMEKFDDLIGRHVEEVAAAATT
jgi:FMN-dependent NADH-azoreductase